MTYDQLRLDLPAILRIPTLGGKRMLTIQNPPAGNLLAVNSQGGTYQISRGDWESALVLRRRHRGSPWKSSHYCEVGEFFSYGLIHAAALLRHLERVGAAAA